MKPRMTTETWKEPRQVMFVALNDNEVMYLYSDGEAMSYHEQGWVIMRWKPIVPWRTIVFEDDEVLKNKKDVNTRRRKGGE